jgi:rod shape determining protein RodA
VKKIPLTVFLVLVVLSIISILLLSMLGQNLYFVKRQIVYILIGFLILVAFLYFDFRVLKYFAVPIYLFGILLLIGVMMFGKTIYGAQRWIKIGTLITIQPSEFMKPFLIMLFAYIVQMEIPKPRKFLYLLIGFIIPFALIFKQPDLGTDIVLFSIFLFTLLFFFPLKYFISTVGALLLSTPFAIKFLKPYQIKRIEVFLNPYKDPMGAGYNVIQSIIAIGSGGFWGKGIKNSTFTKLHFVPVQYADFIFSAIGEAFGFVGVSVLLAVYTFLLIFIVKTYNMTKNIFGKAIVIGVFALFTTQIFVNIGMCIGIMPVTGIPLPFVSFGGSAMIANFIAIGLVVNVYIYREEINIAL